MMSMPVFEVPNVKVVGLSGAVPTSKRVLASESNSKGKPGLANATDIYSVGVAPKGMCASDLCCVAAERLLASLGWPPDSVEALIFLTQTPDYILPASSCSLQHRLRLSTSCAAFDIGLGCSGYVYALWVSATLVAGGARRLLLLAGDTLTHLASPGDSAASFLGDAGTATALEYTQDKATMRFALGTDGSGVSRLTVPAGGFRTPRSPETCIRVVQEQSNIRSPEDIYMNAAEIFLSTLTRMPPVIDSLLKSTGWTINELDYAVFNQTNRFAIENLAKRMKLPSNKVTIAVDGYGNTATASIPLAMVTQISGSLRERAVRLLLAGFGAGYSWGAANMVCGPICVPELASAGAPGSDSSKKS